MDGLLSLLMLVACFQMLTDLEESSGSMMETYGVPRSPARKTTSSASSSAEADGEESGLLAMIWPVQVFEVFSSQLHDILKVSSKVLGHQGGSPSDYYVPPPSSPNVQERATEIYLEGSAKTRKDGWKQMIGGEELEEEEQQGSVLRKGELRSTLLLLLIDTLQGGKGVFFAS